jgi:histidyl-tRNA synthetase
MSPKLQPARGTRDILPDEYRLHRHVVETARHASEVFGFAEIATPIFEFTEVFQRTLGDTSDIVSKEMYTFEDRGGESITLRPEFTAGIARCFIANGLSQSTPCRFFSHGPIFRYERPQKGRYRQFHQINMEIMGLSEPEADVEAISLAVLILERLGIFDKTTLEINSLGDTESRNRYRDALVKYFEQHKAKLSEDSLTRLVKNPMRILDSKDENDRAIVAGAPSLQDYYTDEAKAFFARVTEGLKRLGIRYKINSRLVRGLDYYCHTAFEFTTDLLGSQGTVLAGGRYDNLISTMGGPETPAVGFGGGIERLGMLMEAVAGQGIAAPRPIALIPIGERAEQEALGLAYTLRKEGFNIDMAYSGNPGKRMKKANKANAVAALMLGDDEINQGVITLRDMDKGTENKVSAEGLIDALTEYKGA